MDRTPGAQRLYPPHSLFPSPGQRGLPLPSNSQVEVRFTSHIPLPQETRFTPIVCHHEHSTKKHSRTEPSGTVVTLVRQAAELRYLKKCPDLNARLYAYADTHGSGVRPATPAQHQVFQDIYGGSYQAVGTGLTTGGPARPGRVLPFAPASQQEKAILALAGWRILHHARGPQLVQSEPAVQSQVVTQILEPLFLMLQTRYNEEPVHWLRANSRNFMFPRFGRPTYAMHEEPAANAAGYPDHILIGFKREESHTRERAALTEEKAFWNYSDKVFRDICSHRAAAGMQAVDPGRFHWSSVDLVARMVVQAWGELHFFNCNWGFITNGSVLVICAKPVPNVLIVGPVMAWNDPRALQTLAGMCFASVDQSVRPGLTEFLCDGAVVDWHAPPEEPTDTDESESEDDMDQD